MLAISPTLITDAKRLDLLPHYFGRWYGIAESALYNVLTEFCCQYQGAYWHFYKLSNQGLYMAPEMPGPLRLYIPGNGYECEVSADAAGVIATLYMLNYLCSRSQSESFLNLYDLLLDYAYGHSERKKILSAID
ncbi:Antirestriction protein [Legionella busanensis]|uniref:Antirestriction protein n=1 Tax=Legionella busanensis TaxID=190655 RepID=A0A378KBS7_9GAMM|nr:antirestriction protein [Legionella busanensis]STX81623.1 Antirestriction protein [Legionella busanensis]